MSQNTDSKIHVYHIKLGDLISYVGRGDYRIPQFQRDYVWKKSKVIDLFDSVYQEFPIGSFFLWKADREHNRLFREVPGLKVKPVGEHDVVHFVIDGQQRVTSLYVALSGLDTNVEGADYTSITFDLKEEVFRDRKPDNRRYIAVSDIWGGNILQLSKQVDEDCGPALERCWQTLRTYPIPIVEVEDTNLPSVCKIFRRINQGGKRLDRFDLIAAMTFQPDFDLRERFKSDILKPLEKDRFGKVDTSIVTQVLALLVHKQCTERYEFILTHDDIKKHWDNVTRSLRLAAAVLRKGLGVVTADFLPYNAILTLLTYYFAKSGKRSLSAAHMEWVRRWFWRSAFGQHYGTAAPTQIGRDRQLFDDLIAGKQPVFEASVTLTLPDLVGTRMTWQGSAVRNAFLCFLAVQNPLHLRNNTPLDLLNGDITEFAKPEKHHIFPRGYLDKHGPADTDIHALPNFCFLPSELNKLILDKAPADYIKQLQADNPDLEKAAKTHVLPIGPGSGIPENNYLEFMQARGKLILEEIARLCGGITTPKQEDRQAAIDKLEHRWRDFIHEVLTDAVGDDYWRTNIPSDVAQNAANKIKDDLKKHPDLKPEALDNPRRRLDYLNVGDYVKVIENGSNWGHFSSTVRRKQDIETHMNAFGDYRNCVVHSRSMSELTRMAGETAMIWLGSILPDESQPEEVQDDE